ncbi:MAG: hypothetical protein DDT22_01163 [candidate division WS2 bacterium]|nr:hypothetical protein [Candidatus Lithacetigena glycinireducens]
MATPIILFNNRFDDGIPVATSTAAGSSVLNIRDGRTYTFWQAATAGTNFITVDCGIPRITDCLAVIGHNLRAAGAIISVESSVDNITWTTRIAGFTPPSNRAFLRTFFPPVTERHWRIRIVTAAVPPVLAVVYLGHRITFPFPPDAPFIPCREFVEAETSIGKTGHILGSVIRYKPIQIFARFSNLTRTWIAENFMFFWNTHASNLRPFFWAWDITAFPDMVFYVTINKETSFEMPMSVLSFIDSIELNMKGIMEI